MGRHTVFRYWENVLPAELCDLIGSLADGVETQVARLRPDSGADYVDTSIRKTDLLFWDATHWVSGLMMHYAMWANTEIWNYRLTHTQGVQFGRYSEGGTFDWHKDEFDLPFGEEAPQVWRGLSRKLSVVANLSDDGDYEGGELLFKDTYGFEIRDADTIRRLRGRGTVVVFPSYISHTVRPVTRGVRCSIVSWILGPPFS